ncbi:30S ribosomal protein S6e [archaeon]|nr:30S ribosomal protein S6e [archaeon]
MKFVINDTKTGKSYSKEVEADKVQALLGKRIRDEFDGGIIDLPGYKLKITGGSDKNGFPMRLGVHTQTRKGILIAGGVGFNPKITGQRRRKSVHGDTIGSNVAQLNCSVQKPGKQKIDEIFGAPKDEAAKEKK